MPQSQRRLVACIAVMAFLAFWNWGAATIGTQLATAPKWASLLFFVVAGIGWAILRSRSGQLGLATLCRCLGWLLICLCLINPYGPLCVELFLTMILFCGRNSKGALF